MSLGRVLARTTIGGLFIGHGTQKLFGWFDGPGLDGFTAGAEQMGLHPARANAIAAAVTEAGGGALLVLGAGTPIAAGALTATMLTAVRTVHGKNGPWITKGGWEYNATIIAALLALVDVGPGRPSVDEARGIERSGSGWALLSLLIGVAGAGGVAALNSALAPAATDPPTEPHDADTVVPAPTPEDAAAAAAAAPAADAAS